MKKIGKTNKFISSDIYKFNNDKIRNLLCNQDPITLNSKLKDEVKIINHTETFIPSNDEESGYYQGLITLKCRRDIAEKINELILTSKIVKRVVDNPDFLRLRNEDIARAARNIRDTNIQQTRVVNNILGNNFNRASRLAITDYVQPPKNTNIIAQEEKKLDFRIKKHGSVPVSTLERKINSSSSRELQLDVLKDSREQILNTVNPSTRRNTFVNPTIQKVDYVKSPFFNKPILDVIFSEQKHYEEIKDISNYSPTNSKKDLRGLDNLLKFKVNLEYNFYIKNYEDLLSSKPNLPVWNLPYFYEILEFKNSDGNFEDLFDYDGIKGNFAFKGTDIKDTSFLNRPEKIINTSVPRIEMQRLSINSKMGLKKEVISIDKYLKTFNPYKEQFPMYTEIKFDVHEKPQNNISDLFHEYNLYSKILNEVSNDVASTDLYTRIPLDDLSKEEYKYKTLNSGSLKRASIEGYLLNQNFIEKLFDANDPNSVAINDPTIFFKFNSKIANLKRDFKELLNGEESYSEVIGYNLQKYEKNSSTILQEWFLPNISSDYLEWIDTQVKYKEEYTYKLNLLSLAIATVYEYSNWNNTNEDAVQVNGEEVKIYYTYKPQYVIYTIPDSSTYNNILLDKPPVPPDLEIIPYVDISNQVKININTGIGKFEDKPVSFNENEEKIIEVIKKSQNRIDEKVVYESDEPSQFFEIFRTDFLPSSYKEMLQGKYIKLQTDGKTAASYEDLINQNTKYYYAARSIDFHGNISNPTKIFEVELVNENGAIYPIIKIVDFNKKQELKDDHKTFKKYLKVFPAMIQKIVDDTSVSKDNFKLGTTTDSVWNKNMKIRLISKQTGRKIDLNFKFKYDIRNK